MGLLLHQLLTAAILNLPFPTAKTILNILSSKFCCKKDPVTVSVIHLHGRRKEDSILPSDRTGFTCHSALMLNCTSYFVLPLVTHTGCYCCLGAAHCFKIKKLNGKWVINFSSGSVIIISIDVSAF